MRHVRTGATSMIIKWLKILRLRCLDVARVYCVDRGWQKRCKTSSGAAGPLLEPSVTRRGVQVAGRPGGVSGYPRACYRSVS